MRGFDWGSTPLGPTERWPASLRTAVGVMLNSRCPMFLGWGRELTLAYNDAYVPILSRRHPDALGRPLREVWADVWPEVGGMVERALGGDAVWREDMHLVMSREGCPQDTWYTFSYSPVRDEAGEIRGMFCACIETTGKVLSERRLTVLLELGDRLRGADSPEQVKREAARLLGEALGVGRIGFVDIQGEGDDLWVQASQDWTDGSMPPLGGRARLADLGELGRTLLAGRELRIDDAARLPPEAARGYASIGAAAAAVVPLIRGGRVVAAVSAHAPARRRWSDFDLGLMRDVAERTWPAVGRARAEAESVRLAAVVEQSSNFIGTTGPDGRGVLLNAAARRMIGLPPGIGPLDLNFEDFFPPAERERLQNEIVPALRAAGEWAGETEFRRFDGAGTVPVACRAFAIRDERGATVGFATVSRDVSEERRQRQALADSEARYRELADAMPQLVWTADPDGRADYYNRRREEYEGFVLQPDGYYEWLTSLHSDDRARTKAAWLRAVAAGEPFQCEHRLRRRDGEHYWHVSRGVPVRDPDGRVVKWYGTATDIEFVKRMEQARELLIREVDHRAKNVLAVAQSIVKLTRAEDVARYVAAVNGRIGALARAHTLLAREGWSGGGLRAVVEDELRALAKPGQYVLEGPDVTLDPGAVQPLGMIVHELATNAVKYGALSQAGGQVRLHWTRPSGGGLRLDWTEHGGPPAVAPERPGFGSTLLNELAARQLGGSLELDWRPEGLAARLELPAAMLGRRRAPSPPAAPPVQPPPPPRRRGGRVLLVEDNALIGLDARDVLTRAGAEVIGPVSNVAAALEVIAAGALDAAFLDVDLHGRTSFEIADALAARGVPFTFSTGFGRIDPDSGHLGRAVLRKPVRDEDLLRAYDAMMAKAE